MALTKGQQRCVETLDRPLVVAAGAGSGKTFTLTKRIVNALLEHHVDDIGEVCAITFTRKAASELKSRLKGELRANNFIDQALKVDEAWVSTIHGMCARILRAHAIELGIDPSFTVAEGAQVGAYLDQAVDSVLVQAQCNDSSAALDALFEEYPARSFGGRGDSVESMLTSLVEMASSQADGADSFVLPGVTLTIQSAIDSALDTVEEMVCLAANEKASASRDEWLAVTEPLLDEARKASRKGVANAREALAILAPFKLAKNFGSKGFKERVDEARGSFGASVMELRLNAANQHLETLVGLAQEALAEFARLKKADGVLDNSDLLVEAARALEGHPSIAARYSNKFKLVMVDEFQDTDQMQVDMIKRLAGEGARRLCTVGDAQQSIYRFRGADVSVYRRHLESVRAQYDDAIIELSQNFRSHSDVLSFVDSIFGRPDMFGGEFMSLTAGRDESQTPALFGKLRNRAIVQHTAKPYRGVSSETACQIAANRIAAQFADLAASGHSAGDMVVLLGRMTNAGVYAQALRDAGLTCVISGGSVFAGTSEASIVRELVRVIANPHETQSLFNVITSPLFAITAGDLLEVGKFSGFWKATDSLEGGEGRYSQQLTCALRVMGEMRRAVGIEPVSRIVERVVVNSGWLTRLERDGAEGLARAGNVYKAIRIIKRVEQEGSYGPASVMRGFESALDNSKEAPGSLSVSGGNSVRIMTIHASKGLEFPIVAVAELPGNKVPSSKLLLTALEGKVYLSLDLSRSLEAGNDVSLDDVAPYVLGEIAGEQEFAQSVMSDEGSLHRRLSLRGYIAAGDEEEAKRLLYVAITRARELVLVSSIGQYSKSNSLGTPKNAVAGVLEALDPLGTVIGEGVSLVEYGGTLPALVECVKLDATDASDDSAVPGACAALEGEVEEEVLPKSFFVPASEHLTRRSREAYRPLREGVFSYSSIADASHSGDLLSALADAYCVSVDPADAQEAAFSPGEALQGVLIDDEEGWSLSASESFDSDRATNLGTAFHRLAQHAVLCWQSGRELSLPPEGRIDALACTCALAEEQRYRLNRALARWFGCALARDLARVSRLDAEVPFFISIPSEGASVAFLEGEIDLLGFEEDGAHAHVVDYKTGGHSNEASDELKRKHVLQASCYAFAVLLQGAQSVDADFVRVEQSRLGEPNEPQCVRYHFEHEDLPQLERAITEAYSEALKWM